MDRRRSPWLIIIIFLLSVMPLTGGCGGPTQGPTPRHVETPAPAPPTSAPAADANADIRQDADIVCFRLVMAGSAAELNQFKEMVEDQDSFVLAAEKFADNGGPGVKGHAGCLRSANVPPELSKHLGGLELGETSDPFAFGGQWAVVNLTTNRFFNQGAELLKQKHYEDAAEAFEEDLKYNPNNTNSWRLLAVCLQKAGEPEDAITALDKGLAWSPQDPALLGTKASVLLAMKKTNEALEYNKRALAAANDSPMMLNNVAWNMLLAHEDLAYAEQLAGRAAAAKPEEPVYWDTLGRIQAARNEHAKAVVSLHRAMVLGLPDMDGHLLVSQLKALDDTALGKLTPKPEPKAKQRTKAKPTPKPTPATTPTPEEMPRPVPEVAVTRNTEPARARITLHAESSKPNDDEPKAMATPKPKKKPGAQPKITESVDTDRDNGQQYYIQVASLKNRSLANNFVDIWRNKGYRCSMKRYFSSSGELWYRIVLGPYKNGATAESVARRLKSEKMLTDYMIKKL